MRRFLLTASILTAPLAGAATVVLAAAVKHTSTISVDPGSTSLKVSGTVKSDTGPCAAGRKVKLMIGKTISQEVAGSDTTNSKGGWRVTFNAPKPGRYQAKALRKVFVRHGEHQVCKPARSAKIDVT